MAPNNTHQRFVVAEDEEFEEDFHVHDVEERKLRFRPVEIYKDIINLDWSKVVWRNVILFVLLHSYAVYGIYLCISGQSRWQTVFFSVLLYVFGGLGITMGAHRLWSHKSYKATWPVRFGLMLCQTLAFQNSIFEWSRDHRVHHKFTETDADPHNARRGLFFAHMGWLMTRKHPDVFKFGKTLDYSDLLSDPIVKWQHQNYLPLVFTVCFVMPTVIPVMLWNENWVTALMVAGFLRYTVILHFTWTVNSLAHYIGNKPYDKTINATENPLVTYLALGEGWHNFHHVFPYDYRAAEFGGIAAKSFTTIVIEFFSRIGMTYELKAATDSLIERRMLRTGDHSKRPMKPEE